MKSVLVMLGASAMAAPVPEPEAGLVADPAGAAAPAALGYAGIAAAPAVGAVAAPAVGLGYAGYAVAPVNIPAPAISVPAPYTTSHVSGPDAVSVHQPPPVVTKKIEYGTRPYVAAYDT